MRALLALLIATSGCTCGRREETPAAPPPAAPSFDLELQRTALIAFGNSTPLPVSQEFAEEIPAARPALERASKAHPTGPMPIRVARDVPYAQLTRLMQAAIAFRVVSWQVSSEDANGALKSLVVQAPGALPRGHCFARAWVAPDGLVNVGYDPGADSSAMTGVVVRPLAGNPQAGKVIDVVRRLDVGCAEGQLRLYTQPSATFGPVFDLGLASMVAPAKVATLMFSVPSLGPLDTPSEVVP